MLHGGSVPSPGQPLVKSAAALETQLGSESAFLTGDPARTQDSAQRPWYEQERQAQCDKPAGGPSTSGLQAAGKSRGVKFAVEVSSVSDAWPSGLQLQEDEHGGSTPVAVVSRGGFFSFTRSKHTEDGGASYGQHPGEVSLSASNKQPLGGVSRVSSHTAAGQQYVDINTSGSGHRSQAAAASSSKPQSEAPSRCHSVAASGMSATLKGLFGGASSRLLGSIMGRSSGSGKSEQSAEEQEELWFTSLDDFKPICHMLHRGRHMVAYFACANKTGQHFLLKKFDKHKMLPAEERGVRRAIAFAELLQHPNLVRMLGTWETDETIFVVEEYVNKGDILNDCISHPDKYTERHVAVALAKPLLQALAHLHANNIIHRSVLPENAYMGLDDVLRLGHLVLAIDQTSDRPKSRTTLLDYMAPEMLSIRPHNEHELALLDGSDSEDDSSSSSSSSSSNGSRQHTPPQQRWEFLQEPAQVPLDQLGLLGARQQASPASVRAAQADRVLNLDEDSMADLHKPHHSQQRLSAGQQQQQQQQQHGNWMQQPAQLDPSRQVSLDPAALEQLGEAAASAQPQVQSAFQAAALQPDAAADRLEQHERAGRRGSKAFLGPCVRTDRAEWEYQDHYDEKVDIWQLGCMLHELLCGSMPFELDSKLESAGLSLWADVEVLPGNIPPDCADFIQQALTKDPRLRPSAQQLLEHPWLARCQAGDPWRDPVELEAARRDAELATVTGWLHYQLLTAAAAVSSILQHLQRGGRVAPMNADSSSNKQRHSSDVPAEKAAPGKAHSSTGCATAPHGEAQHR